MHYGIGVGSKTSTGGEVIEGNSSVLFDGMVASSIGHMATCKACKKGIGPIVGVGPRDCTLPAGPAARAGDYVACDCPPGANVLLPVGTIQIGAYGATGTAAMRSSAFATPAPAESRVVEQGSAELAESLKGAVWPLYNPMTGEDLTDKLRAALEANHKKAIILTLADAAATLKDMAEELAGELKDKADTFSWEKDGTKTLETANTANDWGGYGAAVYKAYDLAKQFGDYGVKADVFTSKGKEYIAITTKNNGEKILRHVLVNGVRVKLNGHKYRVNNYKVIQLGLGPASRAAGYKGAAAVTFIISAAINTNELVFNDNYHLVDWFGNVGSDMFQALLSIDGVRDVLSAAVEQSEGQTHPAGLDLKAVKSLFTEHGVGIPPEHALRMQAVAKEKDTVFGIRPVERMVTTLIEEGYPTKGFSVKGKSANWGPQAGFICVDQQLSKRENRDAAEIDKLNQAVAKGMKSGAYTQVDLRISHQRIGELIQDCGLKREGGGPECLLRAEGPSGTPYEFVARQEGDGLYRISRQGEQQAIQVLANPECGLPMTADYDLFLVAPPIEEYGQGGRDARPNTAVKYQPLPGDPHTTMSFYEREDTTRGNITSRIRLLVDTLNGTLGRGEHREMFHHSDDAGSPVSSMGDNFPATFYLPRAMEHRNGNEVVRFDEVCVVPDQQGFSLLVECIKGNGYHFNAHPDWQVPQRPSFQDALAFFNQKV